MISEPLAYPCSAFGVIAVRPLSVRLRGFLEAGGGFVLVCEVPVAVAYAVFIKQLEPLFSLREVVAAVAGGVAAADFRNEYR